MSNIKYYRFKIGQGNEFFYPCVALSKGIKTFKTQELKPQKRQIEIENELEECLQEKDKLLLYVGFQASEVIPILIDDVIKFIDKEKKTVNTITEIRKNKEFLLFAFAKENPDTVRFLIYTRKFLLIVKPTGIFDWYEFDFEPYDIAYKFKDFKNKEIKKITSTDLWNHVKKNAKFEVEIVKKIKRSALPAPIDSLAVYQYFSRGTLRSLADVGKGRDTEIKKIIKFRKEYRAEKISFKIENNLIKANYTVEECILGRLFRAYFDGLLGGISNLEIENIESIPFVLLSPTQVEGAAALLLRDIGYMPDFYLAKSLDHIDVRGRKIDNLSCTTSKKLMNRLQEELSRNKTFDFKEKEITIQCKNYEVTQTTSYSSDILFQPLTATNQNSLSLLEVIKIMDEITKGSALKFDLQFWWEEHKEKILRSIIHN